jgi:hypothetical protein
MIGNAASADDICPMEPPKVTPKQIQAEINTIWAQFRKDFPEARADVFDKFKVPQIKMIASEAGLKALGLRLKGMPIAFVITGRPEFVYIYEPMFKELLKNGIGQLQRTNKHELVHTMMQPFINRMYNDTTQFSWKTYPLVAHDLSMEFMHSPSEMDKPIAVKVIDVLIEGAAEYFGRFEASKLGAHTTGYAAHLDLAKKIVERVGIDTFRKATLGNDAKAYEVVIKAAVALKTRLKNDKLIEGERTLFNEQKAKLVAAQKAAPLSLPLSLSNSQKIFRRYEEEMRTYALAVKLGVVDTWKFDMRFASAVNEKAKAAHVEYFPLIDPERMSSTLRPFVEKTWREFRNS